MYRILFLDCICFSLLFADFLLLGKARFLLSFLYLSPVKVKKRSKSSCVRTFNNQYQLRKKYEKKLSELFGMYV